MVEQFRDAALSTDFDMPPAIDVWTPTRKRTFSFVDKFICKLNYTTFPYKKILTNTHNYDSIDSIESMKSIELIGV